MSEAEVINPPVASGPGISGISRGLVPQLSALLVVAAATTLGIGLILWGMKPDFVPVSEQGSRADALQIIELLNAQQVEYKLDPTTGLVLVPRDKAAQIQMTLAAGGFNPSGRAVGLELLQEEPALGTSQFTESARYQHALETELSRTIASMRNVESARVHLAIPKQSVFVRDREQASASVMIKAMPGRTVEQEQVDAVINLVASSIPYLESKQVTVVDQWGRLLSSGDDSVSGASREQFQYARQLEDLYANRIEKLLTPIVGVGRVKAIVTADLDFTINEKTQEIFEPDSAQIRSQQTDTQVNRSGAAIGVPGALTNQPPGNGEVDAEVPAPGEQGEAKNESASEVRNYELDKTISYMKQMPGQIQRLSAAVIIDDKVTVAEDGTPQKTPLSEEDLAEYTRLAQEAVGFNEARGDSVVVFNRSFQPVEEIAPIEPLPIWKEGWLWNMARQLLIGLSVLLLVLMVLRPAVKRLVPPSQAPAALPDDSASDEDNPDGSGADSEQKDKGVPTLEAPPVVYGDILNMARAMAAEDPKRVAKVVKDWVAQP